MRKISISKIQDEVEKIVYKANFILPEKLKKEIKKCSQNEDGIQKNILNLIIKNCKIAEEKEIPLCQDSGIGVFFVKIGNGVFVQGGSLKQALNNAVENVYEKYYLRKSVVKDPFKRENTGTNTPAIIHYDYVDGDELEIVFLPKGGGSENMSRIKMFNPSASKNDIIKFIVNSVEKAGPNPCPPLILGIGIGGSFDYSAVLSKKALIRDVGSRHPDRNIAKFEKKIKNEVNKSYVGIQGLGGKTTVLDVFVETYPCHIASMPVALNINCHSARHGRIKI
ncbi:MAG TPA: fumarate hydratase [Candidatus Mcinerneyibacterium sp.]|nr:fumarate hydratase [Candidatus Mcinerneyibacterium sp.]